MGCKKQDHLLFAMNYFKQALPNSDDHTCHLYRKNFILVVGACLVQTQNVMSDKNLPINQTGNTKKKKINLCNLASQMTFLVYLVCWLFNLCVCCVWRGSFPGELHESSSLQK